MKQLQVILALSVLATTLSAQGIFFPGSRPPKFLEGALTVEGFYVDSDNGDVAPFLVPNNPSDSKPPGAQESEARNQESVEGRAGGFLSSLFSSSSVSSRANTRNFLQLVDYVKVTKVEPPFCVACTCLKSGLTETCTKHSGKLKVTLTATLNTSAAIVNPATECSLQADGITLNCTQNPVEFVITPNLVNGALNAGTPTAAAGATALSCTPPDGTSISCTLTPTGVDATGAALAAITVQIPYTLGSAGFAATNPVSTDKDVATCTVVPGTPQTLKCTYKLPSFVTKVTASAKPEVLAAVAGTGAMCTIAGTTVTCMIDPPTSLSVCDKSCVNADGTAKPVPDICDTDCKYKGKNEVVKCNEGYPDIISSRPTQVCNSVRKRDVFESEAPVIESSLEEVVPSRRHPRQFQLLRTTSTTTETATGSVTATYVAKAKCLPVNLLSSPDC